MGKEIFFSVGEPSGDIHGANLIRELRSRDPSLHCVGFGGPRMKQAGCDLHVDLTEFAIMWFLRVLLNLHRFRAFYQHAKHYFATQRPDAVVLIDYPGFNWWIARAAKRNGIPVYYYGVPQLWAWAGWRVNKMRRLVDHVLCKLPFEADWYQERNCRAVFVGHPFFDETQSHQFDQKLLEELTSAEAPLVTILPGSRTQEVTGNLPGFLKTAQRIRADVPQVRFAVASFREKQAQFARDAIPADLRDSVEVYCGKTSELIEAATCCLACSGSVSLELLDREKPTVILYTVGRAALLAQGFLRTSTYITLVNLLASQNRFGWPVPVYDPDAAGAEQVPFPEYLTAEDKSEQMARHIVRWLRDPKSLAEKHVALHALKRGFAEPGATLRAADYILQSLSADVRSAAA